MNHISKAWGFTQEIFNKNNVSIHRININKNGTCSRHYHNYKNNIFFIESGMILLQIWRKHLEKPEELILKTGEQFTVSPNIEHRFIALENTIAYEIYYVELQDDDIIRLI